jgi:hypothetical protein
MEETPCYGSSLPSLATWDRECSKYFESANDSWEMGRLACLTGESPVQKVIEGLETIILEDSTAIT